MRSWLALISLVLAGGAAQGATPPRSPPTTDLDCSFNGEAVKGRCVCDPGWQGEFCHQLKLGPARNGSGLDQLHDPSKNISTWGGSVVKGDDGRWHMWASEITRKCGIHRWITNSIVVHAVSDGPSSNWHFERKAEVFPLFSHEPIVARAPTGEYVLYFTHYPGDGSDAPTCNCTDGNSASGEDGCANEPGGGKDKAWGVSYFSHSKSPDGPWSEPVSLLPVQKINQTDMNLAPVIRPDGSAIFWTRWDIWEADDWKNVSTYRDVGQAPDFGNGAPWEGEDPSMWMGAFHGVGYQFCFDLICIALLLVVKSPHRNGCAYK